MTITPEETLLLQRERILSELSEINVRAHTLILEFRVIDRKLLMSTTKVDPTEYSRYANAIDAIVHLLEKVGHAMERDDIANSIVAGGWRLGYKRAFFSARDSIRYNLNPSPLKKATGRGAKGIPGSPPKLRQVADLIGLAEWPDSRFVPSNAERDVVEVPIPEEFQKLVKRLGDGKK